MIDIILCVIAFFAAITLPQIYGLIVPKSNKKTKLTFSNIVAMIVISFFIIRYFSNI